uniref:Uncharacterized protein n=1 Tax=Arundo donax TaxID=35708 RepID=A0A0A8XRI3_ARUDO
MTKGSLCTYATTSGLKKKESGKIIQLPLHTKWRFTKPKICSALAFPVSPQFGSQRSQAIIWQLFCGHPPFPYALLQFLVLAGFGRDQFEAAHPLTETMVVEVDEAAL